MRPLWPVAAILLLTAGSVSAQAPSWVWHADDGDAAKSAPAGTRYFRKSFALVYRAEKATLEITADNQFEAFVNGKLVGSGDDWKETHALDVSKFMVAGRNVVAVSATNDGDSPAGLVAKLTVFPGGPNPPVPTDGTWKSSATAPAGWQAPDFNDGKWKAVRVVAPLDGGPWGGKSQAGKSSAERFTVPPGFRVEPVMASKPAGSSLDSRLPFSLINMTFDSQGRLYASQERGPTLLLTQEGPNKTWTARPFCEQVKGAQGMCWAGDALYLVGDGPQGTGLYRCRDTKSAGKIDAVELLHRFKGGMGEHGPHAVVHGPDNMLYLVLGNHAWCQVGKDAPQPNPRALAANSPLRRWPAGGMGPDQGQPNTTEDVLLPRLNDSRGHAADILAPGGTVWRCDLNGQNLAMVAAGFRNHYDLAFDPSGEMWTFDSDMEWDDGLPWYRPVRVCHVPPGADFVWRTGAANTPNYYLDGLPPAAETGRGSPVGVECCEHSAFGKKYQGAVFLADWSVGTIWAAHPERKGAGYTAKVEKFVSGSPMNVTDLAVGPDGALYFTLGGRGTAGGVWRVVAEKPDPHVGVRRFEQPLSAWGRHQKNKLMLANRMLPPTLAERLRNPDPMVRREACESIVRDGIDAPLSEVVPLLADEDRVVRTAARLVLQRVDPADWAATLLTNGPPRVRNEAVVALCKIHRAKDFAGPIFSALHADPPAASASVGDLLDWLRCVQLAFVHAGERPDAAAGIVSDCSKMFPHADARANRELAILLAHFARSGQLPADRAVAALLDALASAKDDRGQQIHYFYCLRVVHEGWTPETKGRLLAWYEGTGKWTGGHSFGPFLENIFRDLGPAFTADDRAAALAGAKLPRAAAGLLRSAKDDQMPPPMALAAALPSAPADLRDAVVEALGRSAAGREQLTKLAATDPALAVSAARTVMAKPTPADLPALLRGLAAATQSVHAQELVSALRKLKAAPAADDAAAFRAVLVAADRLPGNKRWDAVQLLRQWTNGRQFGADDGDARRELASWSRWFGQAFPAQPPLPQPAESKAAQSKHDYASLLAYLESDPAGRKGDAALGKLVFTKAQCVKCHKHGPEGEGVGPDLSAVSKRFKRADILEATVYPSKVISDQYRSTTVVTQSGATVTGLAAPVGDTVAVLQPDGSRVVLRKGEIDQQYASLVSVMPEGLLDALTRREIADLFAYLESDPGK